MSGLVRPPRSSRVRRRLPVQFGKSSPLREGGFTVNVSARGLGITSPQVHRPGTRLTLELRLPDGERACLEGIVMWAQRGMPQLGLPGSMGVRLTTLHAGFIRFVTGANVTMPEPPPVLVTAPPPMPETSAEPEPEPVDAPAEPPEVAPEPLVEPARPAMPRVPRFRDLLPVRFGTARDVLACRGFTQDVSRNGVGLSSHIVALKGVKLQLAVAMPDGRVARADGQVAWSRRSRGDDPGSMGVQLTFVDGLWLQLVDDAAKSK